MVLPSVQQEEEAGEMAEDSWGSAPTASECVLLLTAVDTVLTLHSLCEPVCHFLHDGWHCHFAIQQQLLNNQLSSVVVQGFGGIDIAGVPEDSQHPAALGFILHYTAFVHLIYHQVMLDEDTKGFFHLDKTQKKEGKDPETAR